MDWHSFPISLIGQLLHLLKNLGIVGISCIFQRNNFLTKKYPAFVQTRNTTKNERSWKLRPSCNGSMMSQAPLGFKPAPKIVDQLIQKPEAGKAQKQAQVSSGSCDNVEPVVDKSFHLFLDEHRVPHDRQIKCWADFIAHAFVQVNKCVSVHVFQIELVAPLMAWCWTSSFQSLLSQNIEKLVIRLFKRWERFNRRGLQAKHNRDKIIVTLI